MKRPAKHLIRTVKWIEAVLAAFIVATVVISGYDLGRILYAMLSTPDPNKSYDLFQKLLSHTLLLVIGLELAMMLIRHTPGSIIEVMLFAVARKMLIYSTGAYETTIGVLALAGLFAIRKFLFVHQIEHVEEFIIDGKTPVSTANNIIGLHIPEDMAPTVGEIILKLAAGEKLEPGDMFRISNAELEVLKVQNNYPEKIRVFDPLHN